MSVQVVWIVIDSEALLFFQMLERPCEGRRHPPCFQGFRICSPPLPQGKPKSLVRGPKARNATLKNPPNGGVRMRQPGQVDEHKQRTRARLDTRPLHHLAPHAHATTPGGNAQRPKNARVFGERGEGIGRSGHFAAAGKTVIGSRYGDHSARAERKIDQPGPWPSAGATLGGEALLFHGLQRAVAALVQGGIALFSKMSVIRQELQSQGYHTDLEWSHAIDCLGV